MGSISSSIKKIIFVGGKGGVGKTTISTALAIKLATLHPTILISTDPAHSISHSLENESLGGLEVWELNAEKEYETFMDKHQEEFRLILNTSTYLDETDINQFLSLALPGIDEIMGFKAITDLVEKSKHKYIVIDTAPTGHALRLLFIPELLNEWVKQLASLRWKYREIQRTFKGKYEPDTGDDVLLDLKKSVLRMREILHSEEISEFIIVSKPEPMVVAETLALKRKLEENAIHIKNLIINGVMKDYQGDFCVSVRKFQSDPIENLRKEFIGTNIIEMELFPYPINGLEKLTRLADSFNLYT